MATQIEDVLSAICSQSKLFHTNDFQNVYALASPEEAKLAYDILVAYGFDVKVYHQDGKMSKLYVTHPTAPPEKLEKSLAAAKAYATVLKRIKQDLDLLCRESPSELNSPEYVITFANSQPDAKQILIHIAPASTGVNDNVPDASSAPSGQSTTPLVSEQSAAATSRPPTFKNPASRTKAKQADDITAGPEVGQGKYPAKYAADSLAQQQTGIRKLMMTFYTHLAPSSYAFFIQAIIVGFILSLIVIAKTYLCADLPTVAKKNRVWYCSYNDAYEQQQKQQQEERDRRAREFGLQPVHPQE